MSFFKVVSRDKVRSLLFLILSFISFVLYILIHLEFIFYWEKYSFNIFSNGLPIAPDHILNSSLPSSPSWKCHLYHKPNFMDTWVCFWTLYSVPLIFHLLLNSKPFLLVEVSKYIALSSRANYLLFLFIQDFLEHPHMLFSTWAFISFSTFFWFIIDVMCWDYIKRVGPAAAVAAKSLQLCLTLCDPIDDSPPGSPSLGFSRQEHWSELPFQSRT